MSKTAAKEVLRKLEQDYEKKKFGIVDEKHITFEDYSKDYLTFSKANKAPESYRRDKTSMKNLLNSFGSIYLPRITAHLIEQYKIQRLENVSPRTVNIELRCLSHMMNKAVDWRYMGESPFKGVKLLTYEKKPPRFLNKEEVERLLENSSSWIRPIIVVMLNTGIRESERRRLTFEDIDFKNKRFLIRSTKTNTYRSIPLNETALKTLKWLEKNYIPPYSNGYAKRKDNQKEYVFCKEDGTPVENIKKAFGNACRKAGLERVTPHTMRHTFASHLVMKGVDLRTVQSLLGHSNISTTMIYSHLTEDHLARSVERLDWVGEQEIRK